MNAIGVFDSGVGGLTVLNELVKAFPHENFLYLADTARLPYGSKSIDTIHSYLKQNVEYLKRQEVKAVVVACNSASTALLHFLDIFPVPIFNVIEPGSRIAVNRSLSKKIAVVGTRATVLSDAYPQTILKLDPAIEVFQNPCPLWVPLVEEGWLEDPVTNLIVFRYLQPLLARGPDTMILGCTHYPALKKSIQNVVGPNVQLVDSTVGLIEDLKKAFSAQLIPSSQANVGKVKILCTDLSPRLEALTGLLLPTFKNPKIEQINLV